MTPIYKAILNHLLNSSSPVDAETIWLEVKAMGTRVSIGSAYGQLNRMVDAGVVKKMQGDSKKACYKYVNQ